MRCFNIQRKDWLLLISIILALLFHTHFSNAGSLTGSTGLISIPTAEMAKDRELSFGLSWLDKEYLSLYSGQYNTIVAYVTLGYLPFLEISPRLTRWTTTRQIPYIGIGDRMVGIKLRLFSENTFFPSVVLGMNDPLGNSFYNASYIVTSKSFKISPIEMDFHLGYGVDWIEAIRHQFVGLFGGISLSPMEFLAIMMENDGEKFNLGIKISLFHRMEFLLALMDFTIFSGGMGYKFKI